MRPQTTAGGNIVPWPPLHAGPSDVIYFLGDEFWGSAIYFCLENLQINLYTDRITGMYDVCDG